MRTSLDSWLKAVDARLPIPDPEHDLDKEKARLHALETEFMSKLEKQHADYLDPDWKPNDDWWQSQVIVD